MDGFEPVPSEGLTPAVERDLLAGKWSPGIGRQGDLLAAHCSLLRADDALADG